MMMNQYSYRIFDSVDDSASGWSPEPLGIRAKSVDTAADRIAREIRARAKIAGCYRPGEEIDFLIWDAEGALLFHGAVELRGAGKWRKGDF